MGDGRQYGGARGVLLSRQESLQAVVKAIRLFDQKLPGPEEGPAAAALYRRLIRRSGSPDPEHLVAVFVGGYGGLGRNALLTCLRMFPHFAASFSSASRSRTRMVCSKALRSSPPSKNGRRRTSKPTKLQGTTWDCPPTVSMQSALRSPSRPRSSPSTSSRSIRRRSSVGQLIFDEDSAWNRFLHNETAFLIQRRLQHAGVPAGRVAGFSSISPPPKGMRIRSSLARVTS